MEAVKYSSKEQWKDSTIIFVLEEMTVSLIKFEEKTVQHAATESVFKLE